MRRFATVLFIAPLAFLTAGCPDPPTFCDQYPTSPICTSGSQNIPPLACDLNPSSTPVMLNIPYLQQECDELCWAGAIDMVAQYFGQPYQECNLASYKVFIQTGYEYNCCNYGACNDPYCNQSATADQMGAVLGNGLGIHGVLLDRPLTPPEIEAELDNGRPIIVGFMGPFSGHAAVITGYTPGAPVTYRIYDPWPTYGVVTLDYQGLLAGPGSPWYYSFYEFSTTGAQCP